MATRHYRRHRRILLLYTEIAGLREVASLENHLFMIPEHPGGNLHELDIHSGQAVGLYVYPFLLIAPSCPRYDDLPLRKVVNSPHGAAISFKIKNRTMHEHTQPHLF